MSTFLKKGKVYGLIKPGAKSTSTKTVARPSAFEDSSSDEVHVYNYVSNNTGCIFAIHVQEDDGKRHVNVSLKREHEKRKKQVC